jgi:hypothetical protein
MTIERGKSGGRRRRWRAITRCFKTPFTSFSLNRGDFIPCSIVLQSTLRLSVYGVGSQMDLLWSRLFGGSEGL